MNPLDNAQKSITSIISLFTRIIEFVLGVTTLYGNIAVKTNSKCDSLQLFYGNHTNINTEFLSVP